MASILLASHTLDLDGAPHSAFEIAIGLKEAGHRVNVVSMSEGPLRARFEDAGIAVHVIPLRVGGLAAVDALQRHHHAVAKLVRRAKIELIIANTLVTYWAIFLGKAHGLPTIWSVRESISRVSALSPIQRIGLQLATRVVFCSNTTRVVFENAIPGRYHTIFNGVDNDRFRPLASPDDAGALRRRLHLPDGRLIVGLVGTVTPRKGQHVLLQASERMTEAELAGLHFAFFGLELEKVAGGAYFQTLKATVQGRPQLFSFHAREPDPRKFYLASDIVVVPSYNESFPRVVLEAMALARPIIAFKAWGVGEQLTHGDSGYLVPTGDVDGIVEGLRALSADASLRLRMGKRARVVAETRFQTKDMRQGFRDLAESLIGEPLPVDGPVSFLTATETIDVLRQALEAPVEPGDDDPVAAALRLSLHPEDACRRELKALDLRRDRLRSAVRESGGDTGFAVDIRKCQRQIMALLSAVSVNAGRSIPHLISGFRFLGASFRNLRLEGTYAQNVGFPKCLFERCVFDDAQIVRAKFEGAILRHSTLSRARIKDIDLTGGEIQACKCAGSAFYDPIGVGLVISDSDFSGALFSHGLFGRAVFRNVNFTGARFERCHLEHAVFDDCNFQSCTFADCVTNDFTKLPIPQDAGPRSDFLKTKVHNQREWERLELEQVEAK